MPIPKVSVIIPFYNRFDWVKEALTSVFAQTFTDYEIILIDDGSKDDIRLSDVPLDDPRIKLIQKENGGPGAARNVGIDMASGEYIAFLDSDDLFLPDKLEKQLKYMEQENIHFSHTPYIRFDEKDESVVDTSWFKGDIFKISFVSLPIATPTVMIKRDILENPPKRFSSEMLYGEDGYLWITIATEYPCYAYPEALSKVRITGTNAARQTIQQLEAKSMFLKMVEDNEVEYLQVKKLPRGIVFLYKGCRSSLKIIQRLKKSLGLGNGIVGVLSKVAYLPWWLGFKFYKKKFMKTL